MNELLHSLNESIYDLLAKDVLLLVILFNNCINECNCELNPIIFNMKRGLYSNEQMMYSDILKILYESNYQNDILEIMPLIDDYIVLFF